MLVGILVAIVVILSFALFISVKFAMFLSKQLNDMEAEVMAWRSWHEAQAAALRAVVDRSTLDGTPVNVFDGNGYKGVN